MKVERTRNATRNAIFGVIYKIYVMLVCNENSNDIYHGSKLPWFKQFIHVCFTNVEFGRVGCWFSYGI